MIKNLKEVVPSPVNQELLNGKDIVIYGTGRKGLQIFMQLFNYGIYVKYFCDSDCKKQKIKVMNKEVISPEKLSSFKNNVNVIIGSTDYEDEIYERLQNLQIEDIFRF